MTFNSTLNACNTSYGSSIKAASISIKKHLKRGSQCPSTPSKRAIQQLIKGCGIALYNAAYLAKENHDLRAANEKEKQKRSPSKQQIPVNEGLSVQEARGLVARGVMRVLFNKLVPRRVLHQPRQNEHHQSIRLVVFKAILGLDFLIVGIFKF